MTNYSQMQLDFNNVVDSYGELFRLKYYSASGASTGYDDNVVLTQSGTNVWTSGMIFPFGNGNKGNSEATLIEQGKLKYDDSIIYFKGAVSLSGAAVKIGIGSPVEEEYMLLEDGSEEYKVNNQIVYKKIFARVLNAGSFIGE